MNKILASHLERKAGVYVRQSTTAQVMDNTESTARQYRLQERAQRLGWSEGAIEVIDEDLGLSGKDTKQRDGFNYLADSIAKGLVGGVFALKISRLSRCSQDWQRLLALCAVAEVVVVDESTVYDPKHHDDKLLLDLKGTMSEAELHWLGLRLAGARHNKAQRGALHMRPPTGYIWTSDGYALDPDESVQQGIQLLIDRFAVEPSMMAVVRWAHLSGIKVPTRVYVAGADSEVHWRVLGATRLYNMLRDPVHAGVQAMGSTNERRLSGMVRSPRTRDGWSPKTGRSRLNEEGTVDGLVRHAHLRVIRIVPDDPRRDLLWAPALEEPALHFAAQARIRCQLAQLGPARTPRCRLSWVSTEGKGAAECNRPAGHA